MEIDDVAAAIRRMPGWASQPLDLAPLHGGITNRNWTASGPDGRRYVVRIPGERTDLLGIDRAGEAETARRAADLGLGPAIAGELPGIGTLVTELVEGEHLGPAAFADRLDEVVTLVRALHVSGPVGSAFPIHRVVEWHARDARTHGVAPPDAFERLLPVSHRIEAAFAVHPDAPATCHNDLLPGNVLFGPDRTWLLDYEYAGMNDRHFDLGNLSVNCGLDEDADERLLASYFNGPPTPRRRARLALMKVMSEMREGMWAVVQQAISTLDTDFEAYASERLESCLALVAASPLDRLLADAALAEHPG
jgi:thiamine kinase-like enzyme